MTTAVIISNLAMGAIYLAYGTMTLVDLRGNWHHRSRRYFGLGFLAIMYTCGPHHVEHGLHVWLDHQQGGPLDAAVVVLGLPAGLLWFGLRIEAARGGPGDRYIRGTPRWLEALPLVGGVYTLVTITATTDLLASGSISPTIIPNLVIMVLYVGIGSVLASTQIRNHAVSGRWSVSGSALAGVFLTCALMHLVYAGYGAEGRYPLDGHILAIDILAIPGALVFLSLVVSVHRGRVGWTATVDEATADEALVRR